MLGLGSMLAFWKILWEQRVAVVPFLQRLRIVVEEAVLFLGTATHEY